MSSTRSRNESEAYASSVQRDSSLTLGVGVDEIFQTFYLCEVQSTTQKRAPCKLPGLRRSTEIDVPDGAEHRGDNRAPGMYMQLQDILCRK